MPSNRLRKACYSLLRPNHESKQQSLASQIFDYFLIILILANILAMMLETVEHIGVRWHQQLYYFELVSVAIFTVEYLLRIWTSVEHKMPHKQGSEQSLTPWQMRMKYIRSPMALIDLCAILPFYLSMFFTLDLRVLRILRLARLIKLGRYSRSIQTLVVVVRNESKTLIAALGVLFMVMMIAATGMYYLERHAQPEVFSSIPASLWWALVTLTTVGYGDVVPITTGGRIFGALITILGVGFYALPAGILSSSFTEQMHMKRERFKDVVRSAIEDGELSEHEIEQIERVRELLDLDSKEAELMIRLLQHKIKGSE